MNLPANNPKRAMLDFSKLGELSGESVLPERNCVWTLVRRSDDGADEHRTDVSAGQVSVGRRPTNDLCINHRTVSGNHAQLIMVQDDLLLNDLDSTNGTLVNGVRVHGSILLSDGDVVHFGQATFSVQRSSQTASSPGEFSNATFVASVPEDAVLYAGFDRLLNHPDIDPYFQPIVRLSDQEVVGYEALVRSKVKGLEFPDKIFRIAAMRMSEARLSEVCRSEALLSGIQLDPGAKFFLNTHAAELETPRLIQSLTELRQDYPQTDIVLEVHEAAITSVQYLIELVKVLKDLKIDLAYDDFGAGQARLIELFEVPPKYLKFDLQIVRGLENASPIHRASVKALVNMVHDLDVIALAEGVETETQAVICAELGFEMAQGYYFGRPQPREFWQQTVSGCGEHTQEIQISSQARANLMIQSGQFDRS